MNKWRERLQRDYLATSHLSPFETVAEVITVVKLKDEEILELQEALEELTGKKCRIKNKLDPSIIAGMVIRTSDLVIDMSMASRLEKLSESIHEKIHQEF
ncbi:MAG: ATP synthase F1 subunit delta [Firmicutes bacterium]|nr:ATP synthase F1 subunit delta [Bacillota bacterium]